MEKPAKTKTTWQNQVVKLLLFSAIYSEHHPYSVYPSCIKIKRTSFGTQSCCVTSNPSPSAIMRSKNI